MSWIATWNEPKWAQKSLNEPKSQNLHERTLVKMSEGLLYSRFLTKMQELKWAQMSLFELKST